MKKKKIILIKKKKKKNMQKKQQQWKWLWWWNQRMFVCYICQLFHGGKTVGGNKRIDKHFN